MDLIIIDQSTFFKYELFFGRSAETRPPCSDPQTAKVEADTCHNDKVYDSCSGQVACGRVGFTEFKNVLSILVVNIL